ELQVMADFEVKQPPYTIDNLELGAEITLEFMKAGVPLIAQAVLMHGDLIGIPDLIERVDGASSMGDFHYRPIDIKSASTVSDAHKIQVMPYSKLLEYIQGLRPEGVLLMSYPRDEREGNPLSRREAVSFDEAKFEESVLPVRRLAGGDEPPP